MSSHHPYYRRVRPSKRPEDKFAGDHSRIDLSNAHLAAFNEVDAVAMANAQFDDRVAAVLRAFADVGLEYNFWSSELNLLSDGLLDKDGNGVLSPTTKCLAFLAYPDFFGSRQREQRVVSDAILASNPGWCGTIGPDIDSAFDYVVGMKSEGNYDMTQMHLLPMAYSYYDELTPKAQEYLITSLLAGGIVHGPGNDDTHTSGFFRETWSRAGMVSPFGFKKNIGETENHILMIMTARYLTNQLLYQRDPKISFDNRRNSMREVASTILAAQDPGLLDTLAALFPDLFSPVAPHKEPTPGSCAFLLLDLLQRILRDDFSEYNAKGYQKETRWALVNLCNYAYDHEVRLAARMVLDYLSAHFVVSSNDLRRLLPFRRKNEDPKNAHDDKGFMTTAILDFQDGADHEGPVFGILAGNVRAYETQHPPAQNPQNAWTWGIRADKNGGDEVIDALSDYRIPPSIHDLFVNDAHRRYYQRLHRTIRRDEDEVGGHRNCDNMEIYAGSPSYLITAGGAPADYAIDPYDPIFGVPRGEYVQERGVAVTTTFMPTTTYIHNLIKADELIQFSSFSDLTKTIFGKYVYMYGAWNYGVAPDFACGHQIRLPDWVNCLKDTPSKYVVDEEYSKYPFIYINQGPLGFGPLGHAPGFYLAIFQQNGFGLLEAFDTWLHPGVSFADFRNDVKRRAQMLELSLRNNVETHYKTWNGNEFDFVIWNDASRHMALVGAEVLNFKPGKLDPRDAFGDAGKVTNKLLNGTVMNTTGDATIEITNYDLATTITLDMHDLLHPRRVSETGEVEQAGFNNEVWLDFDWKGPNQGDVYQPFNTVAQATAAVADGGVIKLIPGQTNERTTIGGKRMKLMAPIGDVRIGVR